MIAMPITLNGIDGVTHVLTETGEKTAQSSLS